LSRDEEKKKRETHDSDENPEKRESICENSYTTTGAALLDLGNVFGSGLHSRTTEEYFHWVVKMKNSFWGQYIL